MLELADSWTWDFWLADGGDEYHLFFLFASRALGDPEARHRRASIGHAVSRDLVTWQRVADALVRSDAPASDDVATWTGSVVRDDDGTWHLLYTGVTDDPAPLTQTIASATSGDLVAWEKTGRALARADPRWYETAAVRGEEPFRDPWVSRDEDGLWHLIACAADPDAGPCEQAVLAHASSPDLVEWTVHEPVAGPGAGFGQLEVPQVELVDGEWLLVFCCLAEHLGPARRAQSPTGGVWCAPADGPLGPFRLEDAVPLTDDSRYAGRIVRDRDGVWQLLAFVNVVGGDFVGGLADPEPLAPLLRSARRASAG